MTCSTRFQSSVECSLNLRHDIAACLAYGSGAPGTRLTSCVSPGKLNTNEENENRLGYDLYSGALADFLSEPALTVPISVGLYAKWGSGKSFLLGKLTGR